ncbi:MAG: hypothetical protein J1E80_09680 [Desulfovibrionaceae bacterium]|nr:hypothetical protein [Desulfovibrionaceae bacterium]
MSLESSLSKAVFTGNGAAVEFPFSFRVWDAAELMVMATGRDGLIRDVTAECAVRLSDSGGTVRYAPGGQPLPAGHSLVILRNMPFVQGIRLISGTRFDPAVIEEALDRAAAERQQLLEKVGRAVVMPADSAGSPEELFSQLITARDKAVSSADRAERAAQAIVLARGVDNLEAVWRLDEPVSAGDALDLPVGYFPGRNVLHLGCDGVELYRGPQYEETGGEDSLSFAVRMRIGLPAGTVMRAWVAASNVARQVEEAEARTQELAEQARIARAVAQNAAQEATEQAEAAGFSALKAARWAAALGRGRTLTPVESVEAIPEVDGFYLVAPPFPDPAPGSGDAASAGGGGNPGTTWFMPCAKRVRL